MPKKRRVCVITGSRAEYGLLYWIMKKIQDDKDLELQLVVTGMHLSPEFGLTYKEIERDGFSILRRVETLLSSDSAVGTAKSVGLGTISFSEVYDFLQPDIVLMLGDRFELFAAATAALIHALPIAHIHGGEVTQGAFDEAIRHAITKMSHLHFTSTETYKNRVIQLGEDPSRVFNVGAPGLDYIQNCKLFNRKELENKFGLSLAPRSVVVTWHPVTLEPGMACTQCNALLSALDEYLEVKMIFTKANADAEGRVINELIREYVGDNPEKAVLYTSMGQRLYLSTLKAVDGVVGNSSSGIIEAPSFNTGTVNIGDRQYGRVRASSVIDCEPTKLSIKKALDKLFHPDFREQLTSLKNPHGSGGVSDKIVEKLRSYPLDNVIKKEFFDIRPGENFARYSNELLSEEKKNER